MSGTPNSGDYSSVWLDRSQTLPFNPPGLTGRFGYPGRCWKLKWRDRLGWRLFSLVAHHDHAAVVWRTYRDTRRSSCTTWQFDNGSAHVHSNSTGMTATVVPVSDNAGFPVSSLRETPREPAAGAVSHDEETP